MCVGMALTLLACTLVAMDYVEQSEIVMIPAILSWCIGWAGKPSRNEQS